jgi:uncharacterized protein involved in copper resistance
MVAVFIADGHLAVGIRWVRLPAEEWARRVAEVRGEQLFTADIGQWFDVLADIAKPAFPSPSRST